MYIHMYVTRDKSEFWVQPVNVGVNETVNVSVNQHKDENLNETVNESIDVHLNESVYEEVPKTDNEGDIVNPTLCLDEVYESQPNSQVLNVSSNSVGNIDHKQNDKAIGNINYGQDGKATGKTAKGKTRKKRTKRKIMC
ncbi:hypothetical protein E2542_SST28421 [Spatholobus suberectus]|nr:hypothetical protein E2542_SST28421 [Spatholobus suberectus]